MHPFAFSGAKGVLDRMANLRGDEEKINMIWAESLILPIWRGKIAFDQDLAALLWLPPSHPIVAWANTKIFLGIASGRSLFAVDVSTWQPAEGEKSGADFLDTSRQHHPDFPDSAGFVDLRSVMTLISPLDGECAATAKALLSWHDSHGFCARCGSASKVTNAGWQRQCPSCQSSHFPRTDPVVIMLVTRGDRLLLGRSPAWPAGMYSLLAGFVEPGETLEAAVRREVAEETGIKVGPVRYLASQPWPFPASLMLGAIATAESEAITLDPAELEDARWLTRQQVLEMQLGRNPEMKAGRKGAIAQHLIMQWLADRVD